MAFLPESAMPENNPIDFRAPPPSPIASGRRSSVANDDVLTEFLEHSLRVPDLVLPHKIFPRQKTLETPPSIDFQSLYSPGSNSVADILDSLSRIGCFQLVNYGIPSDLLRSVLTMATGIFSLPQEKKAAVTRSPEKLYGFDEVHGEEESELSEEFVWCGDNNLKLDMEGIWPSGYSNFSDGMEGLVPEMEKVAEKILQVVEENSGEKAVFKRDMMEGSDDGGTVCYVYKHRHDDGWGRGRGRGRTLGYDVIRMMIRGSDHSHALCLHACDGCSEFHVYSKKGWGSFCPTKDALIITLGDQTQFKQVLGRPIFRREPRDFISVAFLYSPPRSTVTDTSAVTTTATSAAISEKGKTISLGQQVAVAIVLTLLFHFLVNVYEKI